MHRWYWNLRKAIARWVPDGTQGVGMGVTNEPMSSGELPLLLDVEGRTGTSYLSKEMWMAYGAEAGWVTREEAAAMEEATERQALTMFEPESWPQWETCAWCFNEQRGRSTCRECGRDMDTDPNDD